MMLGFIDRAALIKVDRGLKMSIEVLASSMLVLQKRLKVKVALGVTLLLPTSLESRLEPGAAGLVRSSL